MLSGKNNELINNKIIIITTDNENHINKNNNTTDENYNVITNNKNNNNTNKGNNYHYTNSKGNDDDDDEERSETKQATLTDMSLLMIGRAYVRVFPEPVWDFTRASLPDRIAGMLFCCTVVIDRKPNFSSVDTWKHFRE